MLIALWVGPQDREHSAALTAFWAWWWPGILIVYPALGRVWCSVCPFMVVGTYSQKLRTALLGPPGAWPSGNGAIKHGGWALWAMFLAILVWEEVWDLPESAQLSATLLLLITLGAVVCSVLWEDRFWCRHLCPIGGEHSGARACGALKCMALWHSGVRRPSSRDFFPDKTATPLLSSTLVGSHCGVQPTVDAHSAGLERRPCAQG